MTSHGLDLPDVSGCAKTRKDGALSTSIFSILPERENRAMHNDYVLNHNRRLFLDRLEQEVMHARRIGACTALLFIDLDHFKEANDQFGHEAGDQLLRLVTARFRLCTRETDTVARLGGDEFTIILQDLGDTKYVEFVAEKILTELSKPFHIFDHFIHISGSIGIALCPQDATQSEVLMKYADQAMYLAKNVGRNQVKFFSPQLPEVVPPLSRYTGRITH
ncbi:diguanylate cyclase domain-containing protein [Undibacterium sp. Ren11W]|uniref:diguanylate cyclase domain-containing protein n=1 Tax=Undibacterium sp. Ren11W TaxID=3413045 RepID=UPI003BF12907